VKLNASQNGRHEATEHPLDEAFAEARRTTESAAIIAQMAAAECLARTLVTGMAACDENGLSLSQLQKIELVKAALLQFEDLPTQLGELLAVDHLVGRLLGRYGDDETA
jgi:hypothetical protein